MFHFSWGAKELIQDDVITIYSYDGKKRVEVVHDREKFKEILSKRLTNSVNQRQLYSAKYPYIISPE